jgi:pimeloyl-ACP methyl ester carboxylesterase
VTEVDFMDVDGIRTRVQRGGIGEALVLIHGGEFGGLNSFDDWSTNIPDLERDFSVLAFDRLAQGHTANPPTPDRYTFAEVLAHAVGVIEASGITGAHLVGHSRGGLVAARLAQERADLVKTLVVVDSQSLAPEGPWTPARFYDEIEERLPDGWYDDLDDVRLEPEAQSWSSDHITTDYAERLLAIARLPKSVIARDVMRSIKASKWNPALDAERDQALRLIGERGFGMTTFLVWGRDDPSAPPQLAIGLIERVLQRTRECGLHVIAQAGHYPFREQPERFNRILRSICRDPRDSV